MRINNILLQNFRNYSNLELTFNEHRNIIVGENAQGKTNLIEAIYLSAFSKSFRTNNAGDMVKFGEERGRVNVDINSEDMDKNIDISILTNGRKMIKKDGKAVRRTADLLNNIVVIIFSPDDLRIIKDSPERRRAYINRELSQIRPKYYDVLKNYSDVLKQKNSLIKGLSNSQYSRTYNTDMMDVYDRQLADYGYELIRYRKEFVDMLSEEAGEIMSAISGGKEDLKIEYKTSCDYISAPEGREIMFKQLYHNRQKDIYAGFATLGPHRDDLEFYINGTDAKKYGSQGQQRTIALSLKLAEIRIAKQILDEYPVLLLDDVLSELDLDRQRFLVNQIDDVQLFITSAELNDEVIETLQGGTLFRVEEGTITKVDKY
ncbi:MAG: DNA replication/repair protein RecF [Clostridiales bacterium]|nr:DNA replication/repair protein RecF [Candidatus Crickella equi]